MVFDDACHVRHATVTEFDLKFVANLVEAVVRGEVLVDEIEELFADICFASMLYGGLNQVMFLFLGFLRQSRSTPTSAPPQSKRKSPCAQVISL